MVFIVIRKIFCVASFRESFEENMRARRNPDENIPGFLGRMVLRPQTDSEPYLVMHRWESENDYIEWTKTERYKECRWRAASDMKVFKDRGETAPIKSTLCIYELLDL
jgi:heme oxygenase (mycobilin-producing)